MGDQYDWKNLPIELLKVIAHSLEFVDDVQNFSDVCESWKSAAFELEPWLLSKHPCLLLAEDTGKDIKFKVSKLEAILSEMPDPVDLSYCSEEDDVIRGIHDLFTNCSSIRGWFSLATQKIYNLDLPEATDKLILGTDKGWLLTLGKDFKTNLLHPLSRQQIPLPPMLTLPLNCKYDVFQRRHAMFITKVAMSSKIPSQSALQHQDNSHLPIIMASYTGDGMLGFARLGDKFWTNVELETPAFGFEDIVYHKKNFYAINFEGKVFMCDIDINDKKEWQCKGKIIASTPIEKEVYVQSYLIESLSGSHIWLALRFREGASYRKDPVFIHGELYYYTINFKVFKLEVHHSDSDDVIPTCTWTQEVKDLGNEALFIGRASSSSVASSKFIKPNSIYFTDDSEFIFDVGGGHDMGIFNVKSGKIQPHFQGISIHRISPSLWCI